MNVQENFEKLLNDYKTASELNQRAIWLRLGEFPRANAHRNSCNCPACKAIRGAQGDKSKTYNIRLKASEDEALRALGADVVREHLLKLLQK